jgi:threonine dehydrogenase-like Zn-dependent dehydrogenase
MRAVTWHGKRDIRVDTVADPKIEEPTDAIIEVTSTNICGSDLHLYEVLGAFMNPGDVLGHEPMGIVQEVGSAVTELVVGDRVVIPFQISCGSCYMCDHQLFTQCETTQVRDQGMGAPLFGYSELYGAVPGGQAELLRVPQAQFTHIKVPQSPPDSRFVYLSDVLPTAWQAVAYAGIPDGGSVTVLGLGPIGDMASRVAQHLGYDVLAVDRVPERLARADARGVRTVDLTEVNDKLADVIRDLTDGRGTDSVIDAVGMEAHGSPVAKVAQQLTGLLPDAIAKPMMQKAGVDRTQCAVLRHRHRAARRDDLAHRCLRRDGRPTADAHFVRQADSAADGTSQRQEMGGQHHAATHRRRPVGR